MSGGPSLSRILNPGTISISALAILLLFAGCTETTGEDYESSILAGKEAAEESDTLMGAIVQEWRVFSLIFLMLSIGLIALAYPVANAFDMPDLRAWADVELGEAFSTVFIIILIIAVLVTAEAITHGYLIASPDFDVCEGSNEYCPAVVARTYLQDYLDESEGIYEDIEKNAMKAGKLATWSVGGGTNMWFLGYLSVNWRPMGNELIQLDMLSQETQLLVTLRDALVAQQFFINHISLTLAPMSLMLGIIFRSFFITRKLGGQMIAFGVGFILVFPATYAIGMYTMKTTIYGSEGTGGVPGGEFCTLQCMKSAPAAYNDSPGKETYTYYQLRMSFPDWESDEVSEFAYPTQPSMLYPERKDPLVEYSDVAGSDIVSCGIYDEVCPQVCRTLPYPGQNPDCASARTEYMCRNVVPEECFVIRIVDVENDPKLSSLEPEYFDACPIECRPLVGLKKEGCDIGYGFIIEEGMKWDDVDDVIDNDGYGDDVFSDELVDACENRFFWFWDNEEYCEDEWLDGLEDVNATDILTHYLTFENVKNGSVIEWDIGCPYHCRWVTADGRRESGCRECSDVPADPAQLLDDARAATDQDPPDLQAQIDVARESCTMVVPDIVYNDPEYCAPCKYVLDRGFVTIPPVHMDCQRLCGSQGGVVASRDKDSMTNAVDGFEGPAEMKSISGLIVPSLVLPLLNLVITFIFIRTISPMIGGGIEFSGMMRFFR
ncbi:hypothetical protein GF412_00145 [Candidatus Micrarchaeota archaeon]|nr:hypothetical protein [Candidatus Micrarchaeota archaeon]MBD3417385.1 hypothetical protein [Candidatus Micrarchaeota archaeon]